MRVTAQRPRARIELLNLVHRFIASLVHRCIGVFCIGFVGKMNVFEAACYGTKSEGTKVLASRAAKFLSKSSAHR